jgi:PBP1b-binding outer membrane lipoprotein LpoB
MKYLLFLPLVLFFYSCSTLKSDAGKSIRNTPDVGIEWEYSGKINDAYQKDMDSVISAEIQKYNAAGHQLHLHKKKAKDKDYLFMEFKEGKLTTKGERTAGYIFTGLGLVATPALLIALNTGFVAIFYPKTNFSSSAPILTILLIHLRTAKSSSAVQALYSPKNKSKWTGSTQNFL